MSRRGMMTTYLATTLADAVRKDDKMAGNYSLIQRRYGPHVAAWLKKIAKEFDDIHLEVAAYKDTEQNQL